MVASGCFANHSRMETNPLGFITSLLFVLVPALFLVILYIQTNKPQT